MFRRGFATLNTNGNSLRFRQLVMAALLLLPAFNALAADQPYGQADITLGASYQALAAALDFRDIHAAVAEQAARRAAKPELGRRGYGCVRRDDAYADVSCVSHDEKIGDADTREIRLQFLNGVLQQFSISADIPRFDAVMAALRAQHGPPQVVEAATADRKS